MNPRFPIYIPSKGRSETRLTMRHLDITDTRDKLLLYLKTGLLGPASGNSTSLLTEGTIKAEPED